ncbi:unnamed protein product [Rotaria sordida]|uniref:IRG-type G domain-containing protein n=1 Tax=Rotaria sordida TaxID=392033 RepID=A0A814J078_9BILA|nr:unnamed protein product [Rotaria sordida]CAF1258673.1 unnamed protein product [Rotaria sordida]
MAFLIPLAATPWGAAIIGGTVTFAATKIIGYFTKPPPSPPPPPSPEITQQELIKSAREKLGMEVEKQYNFAVCGCSGTGKSTFINSVRGIQDIAYNSGFVYAIDGPAPTGISETTQAPARYRWPNNVFPYLTIWDLPGGNTQTHPAETYFEDKVLYAFDCLLLLKYGRFTQLDIDIYRKAVKCNIPIAIVMTKGDVDIDNEAKLRFSRPFRKLSKNECKILIEETTRKLKCDATNELVKAGCPEPPDNSMFVVAAQSYRDQLLALLEENDFPPLETEKLFEACSNIAVYRRSSQ